MTQKSKPSEKESRILTDQEWVNNDLDKFKDAYKTPDKLANEMIKLIERVRDDDKMQDNKKWLLFGAIENAWHIMLWGQDRKDTVARFFNTLRAYIGTI